MKKRMISFLLAAFFLCGGFCACSGRRCETGRVTYIAAQSRCSGFERGLSRCELCLQNSGDSGFEADIQAWIGGELLVGLDEYGNCLTVFLEPRETKLVTVCFRTDRAALPREIIIGGVWRSAIGI